MSDIQVTKWLDPNEYTWHDGQFIKVGEWLVLESGEVELQTGKKATIKTDDDGGQAIFRENIK